VENITPVPSGFVLLVEWNVEEDVPATGWHQLEARLVDT